MSMSSLEFQETMPTVYVSFKKNKKHYLERQYSA